MLVKDIIKTTSSMLNREDVLDYLNDKTQDVGQDTLPTINLLVNLLNLVVSELAGTFIPMIKSEEIKVNSNKIYYSDLEEKCIKVLCVYDDKGNKLDFEQSVEFIYVNADCAVVEYEFVPPNYDLESQIGYKESDITSSALSYGLASEYCICKGSFEEAVMWHERYVNSIYEKRKLKNATIKGRCFI